MYDRPQANDLMNIDSGILTLPESRPNWWLRFTSVPQDPNDSSFVARERVRRSRLASWLILGIMVFDLLLIPLSIGSTGTVAAIGAAFIGLVIAAICNHAGWVTFTGIFLVIVITGAVFASIITEPNGLTMFDLPGYDVLTVTVVVAASILPAISAFFVAFINAVLVVLDFAVQPHAADIVANTQLYGAVGLLARPVALLFIVAIVGYLWVRGTHREVRRADRAEGMAALEHAYAEQRRQLEIGVQQILATHVRIANGDFGARAPLAQDNVLWQIAASLNSLVARLKSSIDQAAQSGRAAYQLRRTEDEAQRLAAALRDLQAGRQPIWPQPTGTVVDELLGVLANRTQRPSPLQGPQSMYGKGDTSRSDPQSHQGWAANQSGMPGAGTPSWFAPSGELPGYTSNAGQSGWAPAGQGRIPNTGGQGQPGRPADPSAGSAEFANGWPSLDSTDARYQNTRDGAQGRGEADEFPPLTNPWYLPPDA